MRRLPVLDLALWRSAPADFASQLRHACHHHGFFQLRHRVPSGVVERAVAEAREFFARGAEHKRAIDYSQSPAFRGYMAVGVENTAGRCDHREQLEIAAEGAPPPPAAWPPYTRLRGPNQWPASQPGLRVAIDDYTGHMLRMSAEVTCALCAALRLPSRAVEPYFSPAPHWQLKLAAYPPAAGVCHTSRVPNPAFTQGEWADVPPLGLEYLVMNLGEAVVEPLPLPAELCWERDAAQRRLLRRPSNAMLRQYGANALKSLARSHPAVFAAHHPDLQAYRLSELPRALDEAEARAASGVRGTRWPFCGALLFPGHAVPSTQPPGPGWDRHRCRSQTTGQDY
ncbi:hypothetical protein EMIHUDRAFT_104970 [Emiliania huxleyi CCMP1516]|uniref:Non-haem dioxygenase N-terminal domain-containing protein n=2 Tax=Emiliania huxleyi TaxID=2903 RepID=A0A0D3IHZ3_EMIH1|nr:hypothetical protein EMIHUDRAFT_104970 [Emiliania huxleyi CCMP1516]EOD10878.1 hypothetical protein EMIHUDRAFT_104970 [Emiliania huxleyi CCMP1516]|eukprot:XP_005763307.1 hypothetical protein EMIHUDRAFT_104970 [Emiliania huxleyi CCMP1516]